MVRFRIALLAVTCLVVLISCGINVKKYAKFMPEGKRDCSLCHKLDDDGLPADKGRALMSPVDALCSGCHAERVAGGEHSVGSSVPEPAPKGVTPLPMPGGVVSCISCHEPHGIGGQRKMLRLPPATLCFPCHKQ